MPIFKIKAVSKRYKQTTALSSISLEIEQGDIFGIIGLSGAGKSTLIRMLAKLVIPSSGAIFFRDQEFGKMKKGEARDYRKTIGMIFQHFNLLSSRTVAENIAYPLEIAGMPQEKQRARIDELLRLTGLEDKKHVYPSRLSGGEKQRVGIARALANHPQVLLCDEATSALDPKNTREILNLLKNINKELGVTIVLITHQMEVIKQICNKVAVIEKGTIVEEGPVTEVFVSPKHHTTEQFLKNPSHEIPPEFFQKLSPSRKLLRLKFKGKAAGEPLISAMVRKFHVDANILLGWIDRLQNLILGTLVIELTGAPESIQNALNYLDENGIHYEVLKNELS